ncbi:MAG: hypothetical protein RLZ55_1473 [Actinomycetota bacterium]
MRQIPASGLIFDVSLAGPEDGTPVVLLHGFPQDHTCWDEVVADLAAAGYRTIAPDLRGYSPGARPPRAADYQQGAIVADVLGLLDVLGHDSAHIIGHDWGGASAWALASAAPDRVRTLSVLSTPYPAAMAAVALRSTQLLKSWYMGLFQIPLVAERALQPGGPMWRAMMRGLPRASVERYTANASAPGALSAMLRWYRAAPLDFRRPSVGWHRITVRTLYIWGQDDPALGKAAAEATARYVTGPYTFVALPGQGHWLPERAAEEVVPLLLEHLGGDL